MSIKKVNTLATQSYVGIHTASATTGLFSVLDTFLAPYLPYTFAFSPDGTKAYIGTGIALEPDVVVTSTVSPYTVEAIIGTSVGISGRIVNVSPDGLYVYVGDVGTNLDIISTTVNAVIASVGLLGSFGVAFSPDSSIVYAIQFDDPASLHLYDPIGTPISTVNIGGDIQTGISISPDGSKLYVTTLSDLGTAALKVVSTSSLTVLASVPLSQPEMGRNVISSDGLFVYVRGSSGDQSISVIDVISTVTNTKVETITAPVGFIGTSVAVSVDYIFWGCEEITNALLGTTVNSLLIIDRTTYAVLQTLPLGGPTIIDVQVNPVTGFIWVTDPRGGTSANGEVHVVGPGGGTAIARSTTTTSGSITQVQLPSVRTTTLSALSTTTAH